MDFARMLLIAAAVGFLSTLANAEATIEPINYRGWDLSYRLSTEAVSLVVVPEIGGRIMEYSLVGENVIWENELEFGRLYPMVHRKWHNYGGYKTWYAPQSRWDEWPDPFLDYGKANAEVFKPAEPGSVGIRIVGAPSLKTGLLIIKEIVMDAQGRVHLAQKFRNISDKVIEWSIWDVTQVKTPCFVVFPVNPKGKFPQGFKDLCEMCKSTGKQWTVVDDLCVVRYLGELGKIGADAPEGWMLWVYGNTYYAKRWKAPDPKATYPDDGCSAEVFTAKDFPYVEMEVLGPLTKIAPGKTVSFVEQWEVTRTYPAVRESSAAIALAKRLRATGKLSSLEP